MADITVSLKRVLPWEGGYSNDPTDPGGETNHGITKKVALEFGYTGPMVDIPMEIVRIIYTRGYWGPLSLDLVESQKIADQIFQGAVNQGVGRWAKFMQSGCIAVIHGLNLKVDGEVGPYTVNAVNMIATKGLDVEYSKRLYQSQIDRYKLIILKNPQLEKYRKGWDNRAADFLL